VQLDVTSPAFRWWLSEQVAVRSYHTEAAHHQSRWQSLPVAPQPPQLAEPHQALRHRRCWPLLPAATAHTLPPACGVSTRAAGMRAQLLCAAAAAHTALEVRACFRCQSRPTQLLADQRIAHNQERRHRHHLQSILQVVFVSRPLCASLTLSYHAADLVMQCVHVWLHEIRSQTHCLRSSNRLAHRQRGTPGCAARRALLRPYRPEAAHAAVAARCAVRPRHRCYSRSRSRGRWLHLRPPGCKHASRARHLQGPC
jgi:hypothetical protein